MPDPATMSGPDVRDLEQAARQGPAAAGEARDRGRRPPAPARGGRRRGGSALPFVLLIPSLIAIVGLLAYPLVTLLRMSFQQLGLAELIQRKTVWVGLDNYATIVTDRFFWVVTARTIVFAFVSAGLTMAAGVLIALLMRRLGRGMRLLVSIGMLMAWATPVASAAVLYRWLFDSEFGVVNQVVTLLTPWELTGHAWFFDSWSAWAVILLLVVWQAVPFVALTVYAGLTSIPVEIYEAARIDGAGPWRQFWGVTAPMIRPVLLILTTLSLIWDLKIFTQVYILTRGGPNKGTTVLNIYTYQEGFGASRFGVASAAAVVMVAITLVVTLWYVRSMLRVGDDL
jgi:N,N'-diacetylchitobiose transport system permease protein